MKMKIAFVVVPFSIGVILGCGIGLKIMAEMRSPFETLPVVEAHIK